MLRISPSLIIAAIFAIPLSAQANVEKTFSWAFSTDAGSGTRCIDCSSNSAGTFNGTTASNTGNVLQFQTSSFVDNNTGLNTTSNNVSVAGFSTTNDANDPNPNSFEKSQIRMWNGLGIVSNEDWIYNSTTHTYSETAPHHAMDNDGGTGANTATPDEKTDNGDVDAALFSFNDAINLTSIRIGWENTTSGENDADISILRYVGAATDAASLRAAMFNKTFSDLTSVAGGWEFVSHIANLANNGSNLNSKTDISSNTSGKTSSYWLISAFTGFADSSYTGTNTQITALGNAGLDFGNDYFKIAGLGGKSITPDVPSTDVPEPTSLVLLTLGLIGWRMAKKGRELLNLADSALSTSM